MKTLLYLTLGALLACPLLARADETSTNAAPSGPPPGGDGGGGGGGEWHHHMDFLTDAEQAQLKKDHDAALAANPTLATQMQTLDEQMKEAHESGEKPTADQMQQMKSLHDQLDAAMLKIDPTVAPILAKVKAHHHHGGPGGGGPPPPPPDSGT